MRRLRRNIWSAFAGAAILAIAFGAVALTGGRDAAAATTLKIRAGDGEAGYAVNLFLPKTATVTKGDTVEWKFGWFEPHSVTFGTPTGDPSPPSHPNVSPVPYDGTGLVNSGLVFGKPTGSPTFAVTFTKAGTYPYFCFLHPNMTAAITVVESGTADTQAQIDARGTAEYTPALAELKALKATLDKPATSTPKQGGGTKFGAVIAGETLGGDVMQFFPPSLTVKQGDSIEWTSGVHAPHTISFGQPNVPIPPDPTELAAIRPGASYEGAGFWHSGALGIDWPGGLKWEMTFSKAGTYEYYCLYHADQGMVGTVVVQAAQATTPTATASPSATATASPSTTTTPAATATATPRPATPAPTAAPPLPTAAPATPTLPPPLPPATGAVEAGSSSSATWFFMAGAVLTAVAAGAFALRARSR